MCEDDRVPNNDRLSGLDSSFLHMERDGAHMHVASTIIFEGPAPTHEEFRDHIASRLHLVPHVNCRVADLPVRKILFGRHIIADLTLPYGEVLLDYLA